MVSDLHVGRIIYTWLKVILFIAGKILIFLIFKIGFCREDTYIPS